MKTNVIEENYSNLERGTVVIRQIVYIQDELTSKRSIDPILLTDFESFPRKYVVNSKQPMK